MSKNPNALPPLTHHEFKFVTTQDIVIPAGTELGPSPTRISHFVPHVMAVIAHGKDHVSTWNIDLEEALALGLVREGVQA